MMMFVRVVFLFSIMSLLSGCFTISETDYPKYTVQGSDVLRGKCFAVKGFSLAKRVQTGYSSGYSGGTATTYSYNTGNNYTTNYGGPTYQAHYSYVEDDGVRKMVCETLERFEVNINSNNPEFIIVGEVDGGTNWYPWYIYLPLNLTFGLTFRDKAVGRCTIKVYKSDGTLATTYSNTGTYDVFIMSPIPFGTWFDTKYWGDYIPSMSIGIATNKTLSEFLNDFCMQNIGKKEKEQSSP